MKNPITIRYVTETDFQEIFCLLEQLWPNKKLDFDKMLFVFNRNLAADYKRLICAEINSKIVGFCSLTIKDNLWQQGLLGNVDELVIDEQFRCKGIGTSLMQKITEIAKQTGCVQIELDSALHRIQSHTFYRNLGFESRAYLFSKSI